MKFLREREMSSNSSMAKVTNQSSNPLSFCKESKKETEIPAKGAQWASASTFLAKKTHKQSISRMMLSSLQIANK